MDYYLKPSILFDLYSYLGWNDLRYHSGVVDQVWGQMCEYYCRDNRFRKGFEQYGGKSTLNRRVIFLNYINILLRQFPIDIPKIMCEDRDFVLCYLKYRGSIEIDSKFWNDAEIMLEKIKRKKCRPGDKLSGNRDWMLSAVKYCGEILECVGVVDDREIVKAAVEQNGLALEYASIGLRCDVEIVKTAVSQNGLSLQYVGDDFKSDVEIVKLAVFQNGRALMYASHELKRNRELVLEAVKNTVEAFEYADKMYDDDEEILLESVKANRSIEDYIPERLKLMIGRARDDFALKLVRCNGLMLEYVNPVLRGNFDIVLSAVRHNAKALQYASDELRGNRKIVLEAVKVSGVALEHANPMCVDMRMALEAVRQDGIPLRYVPVEKRNDSKLIWQSIRPRVGMWKTPEFYKKELVEKFLKWGYPDFAIRDYHFAGAYSPGNLLRWASDDIKANKELVLKIMSYNGRALESVNPLLRSDRDVVLRAVYNCGSSFRYSDPIIRSDREIAYQAIKDDYQATCWFDSSLKADKEFMTKTIQYDDSGTCSALFYAMSPLPEDEKFVLACIQQSMKVVPYVIPIF